MSGERTCIGFEDRGCSRAPDDDILRCAECESITDRALRIQEAIYTLEDLGDEGWEGHTQAPTWAEQPIAMLRAELNRLREGE